MKKNFENNTVVIIGAGKISKEYIKSLIKLKVKNIFVISNNTKKLRLKEFSNDRIFTGGYKKNLKNFEKIDLLIIAIPIPKLLNALKYALTLNIQNILLEKPGSLYSKELEKISKSISNQTVCLGYNRLVYPSLKKLQYLTTKDGGITSCKFSLSERIHTIDFKKYSKQELERWGLCNPIHVLSMVFSTIGFPTTIFSTQTGSLEWHQTGSSFVGNGISEKNIPFSYHADWRSVGRWSLEIFTKKHSFKLEPIEELYQNKIGSTNWTKVTLKQKFPELKAGIPEILELMLSKNQQKNDLFQIADSIKLLKNAEKIFGYK